MFNYVLRINYKCNSINYMIVLISYLNNYRILPNTSNYNKRYSIYNGPINTTLY